jgi:hypothetical protein
MSILIEAKRIEARHALLESLDNSNRKSYIQWETVGTYLREAALSPQQIQGLFGEIEKTATAGGANRTGIGQAKDKVDQVIMKPWNDLKAKIYNSGPMEGFASKYEEAAEKLKASAGGDEGAVMKIITKYRAFAEKHPIMQGFIYAALIAAAGVSGAGLGGAAALGLFKLTDQLLQGKDIRSALYSAGKTSALAVGASSLGDLIKGGGDAVGGGVDGITDVDAGTAADMRAAGIQDIAGGTSIDDIVSDFDGKLSTAEMNMITDLPSQDGIPQNVLDQYNVQLDTMYGDLNLADYKPGTPLSREQMDAIIDMDNANAIPDDVNDQFNAQLEKHLDSTGLDQSGDVATVDGDQSAEIGADGAVGDKVEVLDSPKRGDIQTAETKDALIQDGDKIDQRLSKGSVKTYIDAENSGGGVQAKYTITQNAEGEFVKTYTRPLGGGGGGGANISATDIDPEDVRVKSGSDFSKDAQGGSVADNIEQRKAALRAKADLVAPSGTGQGIVVRGDIPITDPELIDQFNSQFPGTEAMSPEATEWLRTNVDGAAENLDAKAAAQIKPSADQLAARKKSMAFQSGHSLRTNVLSEDQVAKLFVAVALGNHKLMEAPGLLQRAKAQISKGVTAAAGKAKQIGTNITTKITADKLMKAWTKAGKPTDSIQVAQFLTNFGVDAAVLQQSYQTAGMKMPDIKKIATDDPVMALAQKINQNPAIKKQVIAYLQQAT